MAGTRAIAFKVSGLKVQPSGRRKAVQGRFRTLVEVGALKLPLHWASGLSHESTIKTRHPEFADFVRAIPEAIQIYKIEKEWTKGVIGKYLRTNDAENLERAYNSFHPWFPEVQHPTADDV